MEKGEKLKSLARDLAKDIKTEKDLSDLSQTLLKLSVETALGVEIDEDLGYERHAPASRNSGNNRNGHSRKRLKGDFVEIEIKPPRDRNGSFEPQLIKKGQTRFTAFEDQILALYARAMTHGILAQPFTKCMTQRVPSPHLPPV